jgi:OmpA-OmpF porin, OOP family
MASMMDSILGMITPDMQQAIASRLGESPQAVQSGLGTATAATLGGLAVKADDSGFMHQIIGLVSGGGGQNVLSNLAGIASGGSSGGAGDLISRFLPMVFGNQQGQIASAISQRAGLSGASGGALLQMAAPLVLGFLGKLHSSGSLNASSLGNMLKAEVPNLQSQLPAGLMNTLSGGAGRAMSAVQSGVQTAGRPKWLWPVLIIIALLVLWWLMRSFNTPKEVVQPLSNAASTATTAVGNAASSAWAALGDLIKIKLPDGTELNAPALGVEAKLVKYLNDGSSTISDDTWFDFDRLLFDTGAATLQPASQEQLSNIAAIMKAYPNVKILLGGYTDNTGDAAANVKLSQERADNVMAELVKAGVDASRMTAKGYGEEHPVADNTTEDGRQKNRRISLHVTAK